MMSNFTCFSCRKEFLSYDKHQKHSEIKQIIPITTELYEVSYYYEEKKPVLFFEPVLGLTPP